MNHIARHSQADHGLATPAMRTVILPLLLVAACLDEGPPAEDGSSSAPWLLVDTDMGLDDARVVVALPMQSVYHVVGIVTVEGSAGAVKGADNVLRLLEAVGGPAIPVTVGATDTLVGDPIPPPSWRQMANGLGGISLTPADRSIEAVDGATFIETQLRQSTEPVTVLAIGPLTNLAIVLERSPDVAARIRLVALLGDFVGCTSYNCSTDPNAAEAVMGSGVPILMVRSSAIAEAPFDAALLTQVQALAGPAAQLVSRFMAKHSDGYMKLWDDAVLAGLLDETILTYESDAPSPREAIAVDSARLRALLLAIWDQPHPLMP